MIVSLDRSISHSPDRCFQYVSLRFALINSGMGGSILETITETSALKPCVKVGHYIPYWTYYHLCCRAAVCNLPGHQSELVSSPISCLIVGIFHQLLIQTIQKFGTQIIRSSF